MNKSERLFRIFCAKRNDRKNIPFSTGKTLPQLRFVSHTGSHKSHKLFGSLCRVQGDRMVARCKASKSSCKARKLTLAKRIAFSLIELMISLITISIIATAFTPVITKKLSASSITVGSMGGGIVEFASDCSAWGSHCPLCTDKQCVHCTLTCASDEFTYIRDCVCKKCDEEYDENCVTCDKKTCTKCKDGYKLHNNTCTPCPKGQYGDDGLTCKNADAGYYVPSEGSSTQTPCPIGKYQPDTGKDSCIDCPAGSYNTTTGNTNCITCEEDYSCTGGSNHTQCAANEGSYEGSSMCESCVSNCASCTRPDVCEKCDSGYYLNSSNTCTQCTAGYSCNGTTTQTKCSAGYYAAAGSSSCTKCSAGKYSAAGASSCTKCSAGKYSAAGASSCTKCSAGYYSAAGASSCTACSSGYYSNAGASSCTKCSTTWSNCTKCSNTACTACKTGYKVSSGKCVVEFDCSESIFMKIGSLCVTRYNMGDKTKLTIPSTITMKTASSSSSSNCTASKCCWEGTTCDSYYTTTTNGSYTTSKRTVCNYNAAKEICSNFDYGGKTWRLPTETECKKFVSNSKGKGDDGLMLCDIKKNDDSSWCGNGGSGRCLGSVGDLCAPHQWWSSTKYTYFYLSEGYTYGPSGGESSDGKYAISVRCVTSM